MKTMTDYQMNIIEVEYDLDDVFKGLAVKLPEEENIYIALNDEMKKARESIFKQVKEAFLKGNYMLIQGNLVVAF